MERETSELSLKKQAELLSLSRSSLYYQPVPVSAEEIALKPVSYTHLDVYKRQTTARETLCKMSRSRRSCWALKRFMRLWMRLRLFDPHFFRSRKEANSDRLSLIHI